MSTIIGAIEITAFLLIIVAIVRFTFCSSQLNARIRLFLNLVLFVLLFISLSNAAEWTHFSSDLDQIEDYVGIILPLLWCFFFYACFTRLSEEDLRESRECLEVTLNSLSDAVVTTDQEGIITSMNPAAERLMECTFEEAEKRKFSELFTIRDAESGEESASPLELVAGAENASGKFQQKIFITDEGEELFLEESAASLKDSGGSVIGVVLVFRDVTERLRTEEQLHQSQKMDAIGRLAGGVAHDFNNMLSAIIGTAEVLSLRLTGNDEALQGTRRIVDAALSAAELTAKLLTFSSKGNKIYKTIDMHTLIEDVLAILERTLDRKIEIAQAFEAEDINITGNLMHLQNSLINLMLNARDAMPSGGLITVKTSNIIMSPQDCSGSAFYIKPGKYLQISIADTGTGMDKRTKRRVFEPFFTTKKTGEGTGLGLSIVYRTIQDHQGDIRLYSELRKGSVFKILLPVSTNQVEEIEETDDVVKGSGHILIIDDEEIVLHTAAELLESLGYTVFTASNGPDGAKILVREKDRISMVLLDLIMPRQNGRETFYELRKIKPELKVLLASGFAMDTNCSDLFDNGASGFIGKPYRLMELSQKVAEILKNCNI